MNDLTETFAKLDVLATRGLSIASGPHIREGRTLTEVVAELRRVGHIGPKQAAEILEAEKLIVVTTYTDDGLYYRSAATTVGHAVERVLKQYDSVLAIW